FSDGTRIKEAAEWPKRRAEILKLFQSHVYGTMPTSDDFKIELFEQAESFGILDGRGTAQEVEIKISRNDRHINVRLLTVRPANAKGPVPFFVGYNFVGNHTVLSSRKIQLRGRLEKDGTIKPADESKRGSRRGRWDVGQIVDAGYGLVTAHYADVDPDYYDEFKNGVHRLYPELQNRPDNWTSIGGWAWGLSRILDHLQSSKHFDAKRAIVFGHSRLGKTSLWAGATDPRFAIVISNDSGCGGAALARRHFGETVARITEVFPHWFCAAHNKYRENESELPVDQHMLISLMAPRPVCIASAEGDRWADPKGEFLSGYHAQPVYSLLGKPGGLPEKMPAVDSPVGDRIGYHMRTGKHDVKPYDWTQYIKFAKRHF
ncbi:MAG: acetylxylan esterase, partial [Planctomycetota bacterium]